ncbi:MAG TPA: cupin domain-containing protein [Rhodocyclaceae bacterium]|nr:cupin domain-containing protein [Rhodocyclaceae bacterium]
MDERIYRVADFERPATDEPIRSVVMESPDAVVVVWHVLPGQRTAPHVHPAGQDTWTVLSGCADYVTDAISQTRPLSVGQIAVARAGEVHGVINRGSEPFRFVSVVAPAEAGYTLISG